MSIVFLLVLFCNTVFARGKINTHLSNFLCQVRCAHAFSPICSSVELTFHNSCFLQIWNCRMKSTATVERRGICGPSVNIFKESCHKYCRSDYKPVCGSNNITYGNYCYYEIAKCKEWPQLTIHSQGNCGFEVERK